MMKTNERRETVKGNTRFSVWPQQQTEFCHRTQTVGGEEGHENPACELSSRTGSGPAQQGPHGGHRGTKLE